MVKLSTKQTTDNFCGYIVEHMKKAILVFCAILALASQSKAQSKAENTSKPLHEQYKDAVTGILGDLPEKAGSKVSEMMDLATSLIGVRYRYGSANPSRGFDCSGFVSYVVGKFGFSGARSSSDYAAKGKPVKLADAKVGDVLVFTGTNSHLRRPGHVGIIYSKDEEGNIKFIHSSSGAAKGVTITPLEGYYKNRFLKAVTVME